MLSLFRLPYSNIRGKPNKFRQGASLDEIKLQHNILHTGDDLGNKIMLTYSNVYMRIMYTIHTGIQLIIMN